MSLIAYNQETYYWYKQNKKPLIANNARYFISFSDVSIEHLLQKEKDQVFAIGEYNFPEMYLKTDFYKEQKWAVVSKELKEQIVQNYNMLYVANSYLSKGESVDLSNLFYVKLKDLSDSTKLNQIARMYNVAIVGKNKFAPLWYTLMCMDTQKGNALDLANTFKELGVFLASEPDLMCRIGYESCPNDSLFSFQWNLSNTGQDDGISGIDINFCTATERTQGDTSIVVAIIDHGIDLSHPDLPNIYRLSYDTELGSSQVRLYGVHGTACAGIIGAASNNLIGVAGIAPDCQLMSICNSLLKNVNSQQTRANGFYFAANNGASVINNSWISSLESQMLDDAIFYALENGRNGLGCVVVFATGNTNDSVSYPANLSDSILVVGAISPCGERKNPNSCDGENWGSNYGSQIDVVAPGVKITTTDIHGDLGSSSTDYYRLFRGTSAACPHAAAVAALILSLNPSLTQKEVCDIIEGSAQKIRPDLYTYGNYSNRSNGTWNQEVGYGLLDAAAALEVVCPTVFYNNHTVTSNTTVSGCTIKVSNVVIQNNANVVFDAEQTTTINGPFQVNLGSTLEVR